MRHGRLGARQRLARFRLDLGRRLEMHLRIRSKPPLDLRDVGGSEHVRSQRGEVAPEFRDLLEADFVDLLGAHVEGGVNADHPLVAIESPGQLGKPGMLRRPRHRQDLFVEERAVALDGRQERRFDRLAEVPGEPLPLGSIPRWMRRHRGLPDPEAFRRRGVETHELIDGLLDGGANRHLPLGLPHPEIRDVVVEIRAHGRHARDVVGRICGRLDHGVLREVHELGLRSAERIDGPFVQSARDPREVVLDFGDERRAAETIPCR